MKKWALPLLGTGLVVAAFWIWSDYGGFSASVAVPPPQTVDLQLSSVGEVTEGEWTMEGGSIKEVEPSEVWSMVAANPSLSPVTVLSQPSSLCGCCNGFIEKKVFLVDNGQVYLAKEKTEEIVPWPAGVMTKDVKIDREKGIATFTPTKAESISDGVLGLVAFIVGLVLVISWLV